MKYFIRISFLILFLIQLVFAQTGDINGTVKDGNSNLYIKDVIVKIEGGDWSTKTNTAGGYSLKGIDPGEYYLIFIKKGYYSLVIPDVKVKAGHSALVEVEMVAGDEKEFLFLQIGGIQVTADRELLSEEAETVHRISSGEIEHMQANSLADVLSLLPGNVQSESPGLQKQQKISIRTFDNASDDQGALFGTKVIVDDIPLTNNADMQTGVGVGYGTKVQTTNNDQYDLREVVAENLEKVEVSAGASSVEYGDHTQGLIVAKTRVSNVPTRLKIKSNPDTREANLQGSFFGLNTNFVYNVNYGYSERAIRTSGDEYHRISGSLKTKNDFLNSKLKLLNIFRYSRKIEEDDDDSDPYGTKAYNRDHHYTYSHQINYTLNEVTKLYLRNYIDFKRRNSWSSELETPDLAIWTDRMTPGTREGIIPESATYFSEVSTVGYEWSYGSKLKYNRKILTGNILHRVLAGAEFQTDDNTGPGKSYDLLKPPNGKTSERPRSYSDIPGTVQLALFAEDRITGEWFLPYTLDLGFRVDSYNPDGFYPSNLFKDKDVFSAKQGTFFNPRFGLKLKVGPKTQVRFTYGKSSKTPSISSICPAKFFLDVYDQTYRIVTDSSGNQYVENFDLVSTYAYDRSAPNLKGYQNTKYEMSVDHQIKDIGLSLTAYYQKAKGIPKSVEIPYIYHRYFWVDWPDTTNKIEIEKVSTHESSYSISKNLGKTESSGIEFKLSTHRIKSLNMRFRVSASFNFKKYSSDFYKKYVSTFKFSAGDTLPSGEIAAEEAQIMPAYQPTGGWKQRMVVNYHIDYIAKPLGIWLTFKAQQVLWNQRLKISDPKPAAVGYYQDGEYYNIDAQTSEKMGFNKTYNELYIATDKSKPNDQWLFSVVVSKSVFKGAEVSLFIENIFNDQAYYVDREGYYRSRNPEIFWGIAFSSKLYDIFN